MKKPLMPKATAVWLIDNTALNFDQIAEFTGLHLLEIQAIADGDVAGGMLGLDPVQNGQLSWEEIKRGEADKAVRLALLKSDIPEPVARKKARVTHRLPSEPTSLMPLHGWSKNILN